MRKKTVRDIDVAGKTVLVRVDYNVPFHPGTADISDDSRIRASLPTLRYLARQDCRIVLCSHVGRPGGRVVEELRMAPVTRRLSDLLGVAVAQARDCVGPEVRRAIDRLAPGGVIALENLRFHPEEEANDPVFASELASLAEIYVGDAFGAAHRAHASTEGATRFVPSVAGFVMARELEMLGQVLDSPEHPFAIVLGGAKASDKIGVMQNLIDTVDTVIVGGGMAATFLKARGIGVGDSRVEEEWIEFAATFAAAGAGRSLELLLPVDFMIANSFSETADRRIVDAGGIGQGWQIMDIGPRTISLFQEALKPTRTVLWNGPMGVFEWEPYAQGTIEMARFLAGLGEAATVVGGGSTAEAVGSLHLTDRMTHVSTGGGASLELLGGKALPGVEALMDSDKPSPLRTYTEP